MGLIGGGLYDVIVAVNVDSGLYVFFSSFFHAL